MGRFLNYGRSMLKIGHFGPIMAHKIGPIVTTGSKFMHMADDDVLHLLKPKSQNLWTGF